MWGLTTRQREKGRQGEVSRQPRGYIAFPGCPRGLTFSSAQKMMEAVRMSRFMRFHGCFEMLIKFLIKPIIEHVSIYNVRNILNATSAKKFVHLIPFVSDSSDQWDPTEGNSGLIYLLAHYAFCIDIISLTFCQSPRLLSGRDKRQRNKPLYFHVRIPFTCLQLFCVCELASSVPTILGKCRCNVCVYKERKSSTIHLGRRKTGRRKRENEMTIPKAIDMKNRGEKCDVWQLFLNVTPEALGEKRLRIFYSYVQRQVHSTSNVARILVFDVLLLLRGNVSSGTRPRIAPLASALPDGGHKVGAQAALITRWDCKPAVQLLWLRHAMDARLELSHIDLASPLSPDEIARKLATAKIYVVRPTGPPLNRWIIAIAGLGCQVCDIDVTESITVISDRIDMVMSSFYGRKNNGDDGTSRGRSHQTYLPSSCTGTDDKEDNHQRIDKSFLQGFLNTLPFIKNQIKFLQCVGNTGDLFYQESMSSDLQREFKPADSRSFTDLTNVTHNDNVTV
ncbi:hypothetical protein EAG_06071 [Camponotus floridanus]|uniref:Uncharacterized protein n=1 Tax=Camponotus floridanus TaxID=104421 RepID=E2A5C3_CAMFO|nr:hypothetical protein EAG_06071 [Camponotus floridanus]